MLLSGTYIATQIQEELRAAIALKRRAPNLSVILVGAHPASLAYVTTKTRICAECHMETQTIKLPEDISKEQLLATIEECNRDTRVDGILLQLPLPPHLSALEMTAAINPHKDVDGLHPFNLGQLLVGGEGFIPCTPLGIRTLLERSHIIPSGKHMVILGRSNIVGKPLALLMSQKDARANATVTVAHTGTPKLSALTRQADILVAALGLPLFVTAPMVKEKAIVIDVGINRIADPSSSRGYKIVGDVDFTEVAPKCSAITPVPKGVGPMTVVSLVQNTLLSYERRTGDIAFKI